MMKKFYKVLSILAIPSILLLYSYSGGSPGGKTGSKGDEFNNCTGCHSDFEAVEQFDWITSDIPAEGFIPGVTYNINVTGTFEGVVKMGFELTVEDMDGNKLDGFILKDTDRTQFTNDDHAVTHTQDGNVPNGNTNTWLVAWTAPSEGVEGEVLFSAAVNATNGNGTTSGDHVFVTSMSTFQNTTSIQESLLADQVKLWPNPASDYVNIDLPVHASLQIMDMNGRIIENVSKSTTGQERIDLSKLAEGIYFVRISNSGISVSKKLLVN